MKLLPALRLLPETWVRPLGQEDPREEGMATRSSILAWESQGQRSLMRYSLWGCKESDTTEHTHMQLCLEILLGSALGNFRTLKRGVSLYFDPEGRVGRGLAL